MAVGFAGAVLEDRGVPVNLMHLGTGQPLLDNKPCATFHLGDLPPSRVLKKGVPRAVLVEDLLVVAGILAGLGGFRPPPKALQAAFLPYFDRMGALLPWMTSAAAASFAMRTRL